MIYDIDKHQHIFAAWAASRAAMRGSRKFRVEEGFKWIENAIPDFTIFQQQDMEKSEIFDFFHQNACKTISYLNHGQAAKLINIYLKSRIICGGRHREPVAAVIHPPIDGMLLEALDRRKIARASNMHSWSAKRWSLLDFEDYSIIISDIRHVMGESPLWMIEELWQGYQRT